MRKTKEMRKQFVDTIVHLGELEKLIDLADVDAYEKRFARSEISSAIRSVALVETILFPLDIGPVA